MQMFFWRKLRRLWISPEKVVLKEAEDFKDNLELIKKLAGRVDLPNEEIDQMITHYKRRYIDRFVSEKFQLAVYSRKRN